LFEDFIQDLPGEAKGKPGTTVRVLYAGVSDIFIMYDTNVTSLL